MKLLKKLLRFCALFLGLLLVGFLALGIYIWKVSDVRPPDIADRSAEQGERQRLDTFTYTLGKDWIRKGPEGLYEMYTSGGPFERGVASGKLGRELIAYQEAAFTEQIRKMVPAPGYLKFLKYVVGFLNRDLKAHVLPEYQEEIYGLSLSASDSFQWIGSNYARQLNYHAAHDIGHALQNMMLVGCTSFAAWDGKTQSGDLLVGRNFDFWVGDRFAENKIVSFVEPDKGYKFASITWGGFIGVVSGMNEKGLTVTINAAKSGIPMGAATPVSLVAREVLQYASNIDEAVAIAHKRKMFVSESFLVASAADHASVVIEKTPDTLDVYRSGGTEITCTNHYQSPLLKDQAQNQEQMRNSASVYRYERTQELLKSAYPLTPSKVAAILRDYKGLADEDIGLGNELALNQFMAHHSVIFRPDSLQMWVSTAPWQMGAFVCYDLRKVFWDKAGPLAAIAREDLKIPADTFLESPRFKDFMGFRQAKMAWMDKRPVNLSTIYLLNPSYYDAYRLNGDYWMDRRQYEKARAAYKEALTKAVATEGEKAQIRARLKKAEKALSR